MPKLSLTEWANLAEVVGAAAVVVSLIFVGVQVRRSPLPRGHVSSDALAATGGRLGAATTLRGLVIASLVASAAHFFHNALFLETYPGPPWIPGAWFVIAAWLLIAMILVRGYFWHRAGHSRRALVAVSLYCGSCISVFGHYLYGSPRDFDLLANLLIILEGLSGGTLLVYFMWTAASTHDVMTRP